MLDNFENMPLLPLMCNDAVTARSAQVAFDEKLRLEFFQSLFHRV